MKLAALASLMLAACGGAPRPAVDPTPPQPADGAPTATDLDAAALPLPVEPPPQIPLPGENGASADPVLARTTLQNGLAVAILRRDADHTRTARFGLQFPVGTDHGKQGAADLAAWLFVQGADLTAGRPSLVRQIERLGGTLTIELGPRSTWFTVRIDETRWRQALEAVARALAAPPPSRSVLERTQRDLLQDRGAALAAEPVTANAARMLLGDAGGGDHLASLRDRDASEGVLFQSRNYRPEQAVLVLEIPDPPATAETVLQSLFASWQATAIAADPMQGPHDRGLTPGIHWATVADAGDTCRCGLVFALPDPLQSGAAALHLLQQCVTMDGLGGRLERLQAETDLADVEWRPSFIARGGARALVLVAETTPQRAVLAYELAQRARRSLRELPPTGSERSLARGRTFLSLRRGDTDSDTRLRALTLRILAGVGEDQLLERLTDLEQPDAVHTATIDAFLALPTALVAIGGAPPADLADVQPFEVVAPEFLAAENQPGGDQLIAAASPWLDQALQAIGGADRVRRLVGFEADARVATAEAPDLDETFRWSVGGALHRTRTLLGTTIETDIAGKQWTEKVGGESTALTPVEASWRLGEAERHPLALLVRHSRGQLRFRLLATQKVAGRDYVLLEAVTDRFERLRIQVDKESNLVRIVESWSTSPDGLPTRAVDTWTDYRTVDGIRVPFQRVTVVDDGQSQRTAEFSRVQPLTR